MTPRIWIAAAGAALLAACGGGDEPAANSGVTPEEAVALDNAANMLDTSADSLVAAEDTPLGNGETPADDMGNVHELPAGSEESR